MINAKTRRLFIQLLVLFFAATSGAAELPELLSTLNAEIYQARYDARMQMKALMAEASKPGADAARRAELENQLTASLNTAAEPTDRLWIIRMLEWFGSAGSVESLAALLDDADQNVQDAARRALVANPSEDAAKVLEEALAEAPAARKPAYIDALVYRGDAQAARSIVSLLESEDPALVGAAAGALAKLGDKQSIPSLAAARERGPDAVIPAVESAMVTIGVEPALAKELVHNGSLSSVRAGAFRQLANREVPTAVQVLNEILPQTNVVGRSEILRGAMETPVPELRKILVDALPEAAPTDQQVILAAITDQALSEYEEDLLALLPNVSGAARNATVHALGVIGGEASFQPLYDLYLQSPDDAVRAALARLRAPALDTGLFTTLAEETDTDKRTAALALLAIRAPEGTAGRLHPLAAPGQKEDLRKAVFKALESVGNIESGKLLASVVVQPDALKRPAQQSLKKLSMNLGMPDTLWDAAYQPALQSAPDDAAREDLLAVLDGIAGPKSLAYLESLLGEPAHPLRAAALRSLSRWPDFAAGEVWLRLVNREGASPEAVQAAQQGLIRIITQHSISANHNQKFDLAVRAIQQGPNPAFKEGILSRCEVPKNRKKQHFEKAFNKLLDDPDIGLQVYSLLGKTPPPELLFTPLFDGQALEGWTQRGGKATYAVRDGAVVGTSVLKTPNTFLCTDKLYGDFELEFEVKCGPINSGVQIRSQENDKGRVNGPQVEIERGPGQAGFIYGEAMGTGWLSPEPSSKDVAVKQHAHFKNEDWNHYRILAEGPRIQTFINGEPVADITHPETYTSHPKGFIGLQVHSHNVADVEIEWRNIQIREIQ